MAQEVEIANAVRACNASYFTSAAASFGLNLTLKGPIDAPHSTPTTGRKHMASGSAPAPGPSTPTTPRTNPPQAAKHVPTPSSADAAKKPSPGSTPRGRPVASTATNPCHTKPSPTPGPKKAQLNLGATQGQEDITALQAMIQVAIAPFMARLDALEKVTMLPLQQQPPA